MNQNIQVGDRVTWKNEVGNQQSGEVVDIDGKVLIVKPDGYPCGVFLINQDKQTLEKETKGE